MQLSKQAEFILGVGRSEKMQVNTNTLSRPISQWNLENGGYIPFLQFLVANRDKLHFISKEDIELFINQNKNSSDLQVSLEWILVECCQVENLSVVDFLISHHSVFGIHRLAKDGDVDIVAKLLDRGVDVNCLDIHQNTALHNAINCNHTEMIELLLTRGANCKGAILDAVASRKYSLISKLLQKGAHINECDIEGRTPLHIAVDEGDREAVQILLQHGADVNAVDFLGRTALFISIQNQTQLITDLLIRSGGNVVEVKQKKPESRKNKRSPIFHPSTTSNVPISNDYPNKRRAVNATFSTPPTPITTQSYSSPIVPLVSQGITERQTITQSSNIFHNVKNYERKLEQFDNFDTSRKIVGIQKLCELPQGTCGQTWSATISFHDSKSETFAIKEFNSKLEDSTIQRLLRVNSLPESKCVFLTRYYFHVKADEFSNVNRECLIMKRYSNNLHTFLSDKQNIHLEDKIRLAFQTSIALNTLNMNNTPHGRLKPSNVLIDIFGEKQKFNSRFRVAIGDYAFPKWNVDSQKLEDFILLAPERFSFQENENTQLTEKSDVYSFGWLIYEIVVEQSVSHSLEKYLAHFGLKFPTNSRSLVVDNQIVSISKKTTEYLPFLSAIKTGWRPQLPLYAVNASEQIEEISKYLIDLIRRCWSPNPLERPSFTVIQKELSRALDILEKKLKGTRQFVSKVSVKSSDNLKTVSVVEELKKCTFGDVIQSCGFDDVNKYKLRYAEAERLKLGNYLNENFVQPFFVNREHVQLEILPNKS